MSYLCIVLVVTGDTFMLLLKVCATLLLSLLVSLVFADGRETVRIAVGEWPPYLSENAPHYGVAAHITREAFLASGVDVEFEFLPWARVLVYVENGEFDASIMWVKTEEREETLHFSEVMLVGEAVFFYNRENPLVWNRIEDLSNKLFGGLLSASYPWFDAARAEGIPIEMELVTSEQLNVAKLLAQHIDAYAMDKLVGLHLLQSNFPTRQDQIAYDLKPVEAWPYRLIFTKSPRGEALANVFNQGLSSVQERGDVTIYLNNVASGDYLPVEDE